MNTHKNPYIGPRTFQRDEGHLFFGREREARDLISLVASERLVVFYAQSGAGKSSIVNTRLIPNLEAKEYEVLPVGRVSGDAPAGIQVDNIYIYNLIRSLDQHEIDSTILATLSLSQFLCQLNFDEKGFFYDPNLAAEMPAADDPSIIRRALVIDQFEELFSTHPEAWEKRNDFFQQLAQAMNEDSHLWVVLVMREDYIAALDPYAYLVPGGLRVRYYMQRLGRDSALKAVTNPVDEIRPYAAGVAEKLIDDLCSIKVEKPDGGLDFQPGQYVEPVQLQVVCYGLWENLSPDGTQITEKDLQDVGDVNQSLGKYYDKRVGDVARAKNARERLIREWFEKKLITTGGIRNMVLQDRDAKPGELDDEVIQALQSDLVRAEKRGGATWYELTHDRLVEPILERNKIWFSENLSPLQRQAALWRDQDQNDSWLLRDQALVEVEEWATVHADELTESEKDFLEACQKMQAQIEERHAAERQQLEMANKLATEQARSAKKSRIFSIVAGVLVVAAVILAAFSFQNSQKAKAAEEEAKVQSNLARAGQLSTLALDRVDSQLDLAVLLGLEADSIYPSPQTENTLLTILQKSSRYVASIKDGSDIKQIQFSPDGGTIASLDSKGITFWSAEPFTKLNDAPINGHFSGITALALSQDGAYLATGTTDGAVSLWDAQKLTKLGGPIKTHDAEVDSLAFNPEGTILASASSGENQTSIVLIDVSNSGAMNKIGKPLSKHTAPVLCLAFSPNGRILASGSYDLTIVLWDVDKYQPFGKPITGHGDWVNDLAFNDNSILASASDDNTVALWNISDPTKPTKLSDSISNEEFAYIHSVAISPDHKTLAMGTNLGLISLWNISKPAEPILLGQPFMDESGRDIYRLSFSQDGDLLVSNSGSNAFTLWDVKDPQAPQLSSSPKNIKSSYVYDFRFGLDGNTLITGTSDSNIAFWDISNPASPQTTKVSLLDHPGEPSSIEFATSDGRLLNSYGDDGTLLIDVQGQKLLGKGGVFASSDGSILVYEEFDETSGENTIQIINAKTKATLVPAFRGTDPLLSPENRFLLYTTKDQDETFFNVWDVNSAQTIGSGISGIYQGISADDGFIVLQTNDPETGQSLLRLWDTASAQFTGSDIEGIYLAFTADNRFIVYQTTDSETGQTFINLWDIASERPALQNVEGNYVAFDSENGILVYGTVDPDTGGSLINLLDVTTGTPIQEPISSNYYVVSTDGQMLAYATSEPGGKLTIHVLKISDSDQPFDPIQPDNQQLNDLRFNDNGTVLFYTMYDSSGNPVSGLYSTLAKTIIDNSIPGYLYTTQDVESVSIYEYSAGEGSSIFLIDSAAGTKMVDLKGHFLDVIRDAKSSEAKTLVYQTTEDNANNINLWDIQNATNLGEPIIGEYLATSPDGQVVVTRGADQSIIFWNLNKSWPLGEPLNERINPVSKAIMSPDGKMLALIDEEGVSIQNVAKVLSSDKPFNDHFGNEFPGSFSSFSPDGRIMAVGDWNTSTTTLWDMEKQSQIGGEISGFYSSFSSDNRLVAIADQNTNTVTVWNLSTLEQMGSEFPGNYPLFGKTRNILAIGDFTTATTRILDADSMEQIVDEMPGMFPALSPDDSLLAVGNWNTHITTVWNLSTLEQVGAEFPGSNLSFNQTGELLAIGDDSTSSTSVWDLNRLVPIVTDLPGTGPVFSPNGPLLAIGNWNTATTTVWNLSTMEAVKDEISGSAVSFSRTGNLLAVGNDSTSTTALWDLDKMEQITTDLPGTYPTFGHSALLSIGDWNAATTTVWNLKTGQAPQQVRSGVALPVTQLALSSDGSKLASISSDGIVIRNLTSNESLQLKTGDYTGEFTGNMSFYAENSRFAALGDDGTLLTWNASSKAALPDKTYTVPGLDSTSTFSLDGKYIVYENENSIQIWDVIEGKPFAEATQAHQLTAPVQDFTFSPDGTVLAYTDGSKISLFEFPSLTLQREFPVSKITDIGLIMANNAVRYVVAHDESGNTQIWDWKTVTKVGEPMSGNLQFVGSSAEDNFAVYIDSTGKLIKLQTQLDHSGWQERLCRIAARNFSVEELDLYFKPNYPENLTCPEYPSGQEIAAVEATAQAAVRIPTATEATIAEATPIPTQTAAPTEVSNTPTAEAIGSTAATADVESLMEEARILVFEDTVDEGLRIEPVLISDGYEKNSTFIGQALGEFRTELTSDTPWDLIIVATETHGAVSGEFWELIKAQLDNGSSVIIETRALERQSEGRIKPLLQACGVDVQSDLELAVPLKWYIPDHPIFAQPNTVTEFSKLNRHWDDGAGDLMKITGEGDATILAGTNSGLVNSGVLVNCYDGRLLLQTFSSHDYPVEQVTALWQNYIYNLLYDRFAR